MWNRRRAFWGDDDSLAFRLFAGLMGIAFGVAIIGGLVQLGIHIAQNL